MLKNEVIRKTLFTALILFAIVFIIFAIIAFWNWHLIVGWTAGFIASVSGYVVSAFLLQTISKRVKTKQLGFWLGWLRVYAHLGIHAFFIIMVLLINTITNGIAFKVESRSEWINPINIFTYIAGVGIIAVSTLVVYSFKKKEAKHG